MAEGTPGPVAQAQRWTELGLGMAEMVTGYSQRTLAATAGDGNSTTASDPSVWDLAAVAPGAVATIALKVQDSTLRAAGSAANLASRVARGVGVTRVTTPVMQWLHDTLAPLDEEFKNSQAERAAVAETFVAAAGPQVLQELLSRVDLDALLEQVDIEQLLDRVDLNAVIDRIDIDRLTDRIDVERLLDRVDVNDVASLVLHDLEVAGLLRGGTEALASSTVGALRSQMEGVSRRLGRRP
jgi:hypothetical protein